ncbi:hypothetical protein M3I01_013360 [Marinomonas sp. RSW2]|uniref:Uncharacterized protein n=1 Tax=Marinomonas maritima TaxID=2940935 RepID=A0ABT5WIK8_9GAMM|nr:hypothetical protein [Marinomonas maritima]MDE8603885.1 hypothetical protein [Marinomonas maritima]
MLFRFFCRILGDDVELVDHDMRLFANAPGTASLKVVSKTEPKGSVFVSVAVNGGERQQLFFGFVERATKATADTWTLFCREKIAALDRRLPISKRNVTLREVLAEISSKTSISFALPKSGGYADKPVPHFVHMGTAIQAVRATAGVFNIPDFVCQQRRDGNIYVGSWKDGIWPDKPITMPENLFDGVLSSESMTTVLVPGLRPNYVLNGRRIYEVSIKGVSMGISWKKR